MDSPPQPDKALKLFYSYAHKMDVSIWIFSRYGPS
jgi:hypothetical protein